MSSALAVAGIELTVAAFVCIAIYALAFLAVRAIPTRLDRAAEWRRIAMSKVRHVLLTTYMLLPIAVLAYNGWLVARGIDPRAHAAELARSVAQETWQGLANAFGRLGLAVAVLIVAAMLIHRALRVAERVVSRWEWLKDRGRSLPSVFVRLERAIVRTGWLLVAALACRSFILLQGTADAVLLLTRVYVLFAVGAVLIRTMPVFVDTLDTFGDRYARTRGLSRQYGHLRHLLPTFRACLEYASWIALVSLVLLQFVPTRNLAAWGPRLIEALGILFAGRALVELGRVEIGHRMLPSQGLEETNAVGARRWCRSCGAHSGTPRTSARPS